MIFNPLSRSILCYNTFEMYGTCLEAFMILIATHILVKGLKSHFAISSCLLYYSYCEQSKCEDNENLDPCLPCCQFLSFAMTRNHIFEYIDAVYFILPLLVVLSEYTEVIIIDHEILCDLRNDGYCAHIDCQAQEAALE